MSTEGQKYLFLLFQSPLPNPTKQGAAKALCLLPFVNISGYLLHFIFNIKAPEFWKRSGFCLEGGPNI